MKHSILIKLKMRRVGYRVPFKLDTLCIAVNNMFIQNEASEALIKAIQSAKLANHRQILLIKNFVQTIHQVMCEEDTSCKVDSKNFFEGEYCNLLLKHFGIEDLGTREYFKWEYICM